MVLQLGRSDQSKKWRPTSFNLIENLKEDKSIRFLIQGDGIAPFGRSRLAVRASALLRPASIRLSLGLDEL